MFKIKSLCFRFRVLLQTLALGLASVPLFNSLYKTGDEIPLNLPQIESESPLYVYPLQPVAKQQEPVQEIIKRGRDLTRYVFGGEVSNCGLVLITEVDKCEREKSATRKFIWKHWQEKNRAYIVYNVSGVDAGVEYHIVIEPDEMGDWHILWIGERWGMPPNEGIFTEDVRSIKLKTAGKDNYPYEAGTKYLVFLDKNGEEVESL